jgi:DNA-binding CsgD family transcriptional regulator
MRIRICPRCDAEMISLSDRRRQILDLVLIGSSDKEIADQLGLAPSTAHGAIQQIYAETGHRNRVMLAIWWDRFKRKNMDLFDEKGQLTR